MFKQEVFVQQLYCFVSPWLPVPTVKKHYTKTQLCFVSLVSPSPHPASPYLSLHLSLPAPASSCAARLRCAPHSQTSAISVPAKKRSTTAKKRLCFYSCCAEEVTCSPVTPLYHTQLQLIQPPLKDDTEFVYNTHSRSNALLSPVSNTTVHSK